MSQRQIAAAPAGTGQERRFDGLAELFECLVADATGGDAFDPFFQVRFDSETVYQYGFTASLPRNPQWPDRPWRIGSN